MSERGRILIDSVISLGIASISLVTLVMLFTNVSQTAVRISRAHRSMVATTKTLAALSAALRARERNRLSFAVQVTRPPFTRLTNGTDHPLAELTGATRPREASDILSVVEIAHRCRGPVTRATVSGSSLTATVCGLSCRLQSEAFKSYILYAIDGPRQVVGDVSTISDSCVEVRGTVTPGIVGAHNTFISSPIIFAPVEREYSLFVDTTDTFRIASHVGQRVVENQPITQGLTSIEVTSERHERGAIIFRILARPRFGKEISTFAIPALGERSIWNEVLP